MKKCKNKNTKQLGDFAGCGTEIIKPFRYGLCKKCFAKFLYGTDKGAQLIQQSTTKAKKKIEIEKRRKTRSEKENLKSLSELENEAQVLFNRIIRIIDKDKNCISCGYDFNLGNRQAHAGHYYSVGAHRNLRFEPYNVHKQCSICNNYKSGNLNGYEQGLINRYGIDITETIKSLRTKKTPKRTKAEVREFIAKLKILLTTSKIETIYREDLVFLNY